MKCRMTQATDKDDAATVAYLAGRSQEIGHYMKPGTKIISEGEFETRDEAREALGEKIRLHLEDRMQGQCRGPDPDMLA